MSVPSPQITRDQVLQLYREAAINGVPLETVQEKIQAVAAMVEESSAQGAASSRSRWQRLIPAIFLTVGSVLIANAVWPIVSYLVFVSPSLQRVSTSELAADQRAGQTELPGVAGQVAAAASSALTEGELVRPIMLSQELDFTNLANWFGETETYAEIRAEHAQEYTIDIPAVQVEKARVKIGGTDLNSGLIQYPGTAEPGGIGAPVVFGHSVLRQFYRPSISNPHRYKSIFSKIMTLKTGDEIIVNHEGFTYYYHVTEKHDVQPDDLFILEQRLDRRQLKLITCVPEGTYLRRGVIVAELIRVE